MKIKNEHIGSYVTIYNSKGFDTSIYVTEEMAQDHEYYSSVGLGYLFEVEDTKAKKYKGVEDAKTEG
jgi:hypothetical protein